METFKYRSRGTSNDTWHEGSIEAEDEGQALDKLDAIYGIERDDNGDQTNAHVIAVELVD